MALVMVVVGAGGLACWLAAALVVARRSRRSSSEPETATPEPRDDRPTPGREEDQVRPAVTASGERIWVDADQLIWHEIVAWPELARDTRRVAASGS